MNYRDGVGVPMKEDEGMKKVMVIFHRPTYPPTSLSDTCTSNSEFTNLFIPTTKSKIIFVSPNPPQPAVSSCSFPPSLTGRPAGGLGIPASIFSLSGAGGKRGEGGAEPKYVGCGAGPAASCWCSGFHYENVEGSRRDQPSPPANKCK